MNTTPLLKDLYQHITSQYATKWKVIGLLLGLSNNLLDDIEAGYSDNVKWCCNKMLENWLDIDTTASWDKMLNVIDSFVLSSSDKGVCLCVCVSVCVSVCLCVWCGCVRACTYITCNITTATPVDH